MDFKLIIIFLITIAFLINIFFNLLRIKQLKKVLPSEAKEIYSEYEQELSKKYLNKIFKIRLYEFTTKYIVILVLIFSDSLKYFYDYLNRSFTLNVIYLNIITLCVFSLVFLLISFVFSYIKVFKTEKSKRYNRRKTKIFIKDKILIFLLTEVFIIVSVVVIDDFLKVGVFEEGSIVADIFTLLLIILIIYFRRLFNKFKPMEESNVKTLLEQFAIKHNFKFKNVYVMDASKRTTHANAYFQGFGRFRKIVLYDTLLENLSDEEVLAIFAHEIGHAKHRDNLKLVLLIAPFIFAGMFLVKYLYSYSNFFISFKFYEPNVSLTIFIVYAVWDFLNIIYKIIINPLRRNMEYKADRFKALNVDKEIAISALKKLKRNNLSDINPHPLDVFVNYTHPTMIQRIARIKKLD